MGMRVTKKVTRSHFSLFSFSRVTNGFKPRNSLRLFCAVKPLPPGLAPRPQSPPKITEETVHHVVKTDVETDTEVADQETQIQIYRGGWKSDDSVRAFLEAHLKPPDFSFKDV